MPIPYAQRRRRRQQLIEELPPNLRERIALRHVETVAKFSPQMQHRLAEAIDANVRIPAAVKFLKANPEAMVEEIIAGCHKTTGKHNQQNKDWGNKLSLEAGSLALLTDLLQTCFPDMPSATAEAMSRSELLSEVRDVIRAQGACFGSQHAESDFVVVVLCGLMLESIEQLKQIISKRPVYRQAIQRSGVEWPY